MRKSRSLANVHSHFVMWLLCDCTAFLLECISSGTIRRPKWILRQFKEETRRLSSAKSSLVTQKWRKRRRNCGLGNF